MNGEREKPGIPDTVITGYSDSVFYVIRTSDPTEARKIADGVGLDARRLFSYPKDENTIPSGCTKDREWLNRQNTLRACVMRALRESGAALEGNYSNINDHDIREPVVYGILI